jgi:ABC-type phosphate/phosphonate transport system ATPase subunit
LNRIYITSQAIEKIYAHSISARPMDVTKNPLLEQTGYIHQELTVLPQSEVLLEFIHYLIQSHTLFNEKLQNMAEPDKTQLFHHVLERLKEEGMLRENVLPDEADISSEATVSPGSPASDAGPQGDWRFSCSSVSAISAPGR